MAVPRLQSGRHRRQCCEQHQAFQMTRIAAFAGMRFENQMIAHPHRIETVRLGAPRALKAVGNRHMGAEMGQQQTELEI